ncbi:MAG: hypothetical protein AAAB20_29300 [Rhizobium sp.]|uniref:hypothetical protein n=1 Tax=Rhizobium sp. TaxID=391 RepID=UPI0005680619
MTNSFSSREGFKQPYSYAQDPTAVTSISREENVVRERVFNDPAVNEGCAAEICAMEGPVLERQNVVSSTPGPSPWPNPTTFTDEE